MAAPETNKAVERPAASARWPQTQDPAAMPPNRLICINERARPTTQRGEPSWTVMLKVDMVRSEQAPATSRAAKVRSFQGL